MRTSFKLWSVVGIALVLVAGPLCGEVLYTANTDGDRVYAYHVEGNGTLKPIAGSPFHSSGKWPVSVAVDLLGQLLFTANMGDDTISAYRIGLKGTLTPLSLTKAGSMPESVAVDPFGRFLYVTNLDGSGIPGFGGSVGHVSAYRIGVNGNLTPVPGSPFPAGFSPLSVKTDPLGRFVYVANAGSQEEFTETISGYRVGGDGTLLPLGGSPFADGESPQSLALDPFGRFLYTAGEYDLALLTNRIALNGILTPLPGSSFRTGDGFEPYNAIVADPWGRFVYVSSLEGIQPLDAKLSVYRVGVNGLRPVSGSAYVVGFFADSMVVDLTGQFLYAAVNVVNGTSGPIAGTGLAAYRIGGNGTLAPVTGSPFQIGFSPDSMAVNP
jgi:6-phosphogluconolactonase